MGEQKISEQANDDEAQAFMRALLDDLTALECLIEGDHIESGVRRIGAEQEMFLVDGDLRPAPLALEVLERADDPRLTTELARFNLEANLTPQLLGGDCLRRMETELREVVGRAAAAARELGAEVMLAGILPTLRKGDLTQDRLTPRPRYLALDRALRRLRGDAFHVHIHGLDELETTHDNILLEACNTSFQVHLQVGAQEFTSLYNVAQAVTAPVLAAAVNSPLLLGHRLWHETRVPLWERSVDTRPSARGDREQKPRVHFGDDWVHDGVLEIFREDVMRFRLLMTAEVAESPMAVIARGGIPDLKALRVHNGTVYRWNRPCYGAADGKAHLRIESRPLPAGPTLLDEVANAAFFYGLVLGLSAEVDRIDQVMAFEDAKANFFAAARDGLKAQLTWIGGRSVSAPQLILERLAPCAREGLRGAGLESADIDRYLGVIEARVRCGQTGAQWALGSLAPAGSEATPYMRHRALCAAMLDHQRQELSGAGDCPVHTWAQAAIPGDPGEMGASYRTIGQFMSTDLFTARPNDIVEFVASVMSWRRIHHIPVEDDRGQLVGLVSHRDLLGLIVHGAGGPGAVDDRAPSTPDPGARRTVASIMCSSPITVPPETTTLDALERMCDHDVDCLLVVESGRLIGIVAERDLLHAATRLLEGHLRDG